MTNNRTQLLQEHLNRLDSFEAQLRNIAPHVVQKADGVPWLDANLACLAGLREEIMLAELTGADLPNREYVDVAALARFYIQSQPPPLAL